MNDAIVDFKCSDCGATVSADAKACPRCGVNFEGVPRADEVDYSCSVCGAVVESQEKACQNCGANLYVEYYYVSIPKFVIFSICSWGLFQVYWFYRNWALIKDQERLKIIPILRALFPYFFCCQLFGRVLVSAKSVGYKHNYSPGLLLILYIVITLLYKLPGPLWLVTFFSYAPLLAVQRAINFNNEKVNPIFLDNSRFSTAEVILVLIGGTIVVLSITGALTR